MMKRILLPLEHGDDATSAVAFARWMAQRRSAEILLLRVDWDSATTAGTRFSHTKIPGQEPLHSEAIDALVLAQLSQGRQLLRGNSLFGPDRTTSLVLEVWQDSGELVKVSYAELVVRELCVPWSAA